jgi:dTDP-glucose pyrophosphorylase
MSAIELQELVVNRRDSLLAAMRRINDNRREVALVVDDTGCLLGVITDGDIRRGLLGGLATDAPTERVMTVEYTWVGPEVDRAAVLDLMRARAIRHVPIINSERRLLGIHFLEDLIGPAPRSNSAVIMAGGKGTRLHPITHYLPKPMVTVAGRPILERLVLQLVGDGISNIIMALHYMPEVIREHFGDGRRFGCNIEYLLEDEPRGTGGALAALPERPSKPLLVMNGDLVTQIDFGGLLDFHSAQGGGATIAVRPYQIQIPFGVLQANGSRLVSLQEKPTAYHLINAGVYAFDPAVLDLVPQDVMFPITSLFERMLAENRQVNVFQVDAEWIDIGRPDELRRARGEI